MNTILYNKTDKKLYYKIGCLDNSYPLEKKDAEKLWMDSVQNLYIIENEKVVWGGAIPMDVEIDIYEINNSIELFIKNNTDENKGTIIPQTLIDGEPCIKYHLLYIFAISILIGILIFFVKKFLG